MEKKHKYLQYIAWGVTAFAVIAAGVLFYFSIDYMGSVINALSKLMGILSPFIWGLVISYLLIPSMMMYERRLFKPLAARINKTKPRIKKDSKLPRVLSLILAEIVMLLIITALFYLIVPQVYDSISAIITNSPSYFDTAYSAIDNLLKDYPEIEQYATKIFGNLTEALTKWGTNTLLPSMENVVTNITSGVFYVLKGLYNVVIGIIVSVYILFNKEAFIAHYRKILYSIFSPEHAKHITSALRFADKTFMGFISGKLLDSAIIGVLCYLGCLLLKMPYALLISVIVGVTNVIPFFAPFIGAVPRRFWCCWSIPRCACGLSSSCSCYSSLTATSYVPKILGTSIGINGFWVLFSIVLFGGIFGFWGMLLGVPVFVIIYTALTMLIDRKLKRHKLPTDANEYMNLDYIDPETLQPVPKRREKKDGDGKK